uniref:RHS repeat-associated core domain-containing protein n=1 Tax=Acinetobacter guillouiae TaxID=106649 RepID=UPI00300B45F6
VIYGWEGNTLAYESNDQVTKHYVYERGTFVPLVQAIYAEAIELHQTPDWSDQPYSLQRDPLWKVSKKAKEWNDVWFYHCDHLGTPQEMTDHTGLIIWKANYFAWGECKVERAKSNFFENSEIISNNIRFQGQYFDQETGLHYNRYRYYSPYVGRFISKDPIGLTGGHNVYTYAPNPINWIDPYGLTPSYPCDCDDILKQENVQIGTHRQMTRQGRQMAKQQGKKNMYDSHHVYQDAAVNNIKDYNYYDAIAVSIQGRNDDNTTTGTPHYKANRAQDASSKAGLLGSETVVAFKSLRAAGLSAKAAKCATLKARSYLSGLGASAGSTTNILSRRKG